MLFRETKYPNHQQVSELAQNQGIESEKSIKMWFQNSRSKFRRMPQLSPVKHTDGSSVSRHGITISEGACGTSRRARIFSPIVIQPRASSSDSSPQHSVLTPSSRYSSTVLASTPAGGDKSLPSFNNSNSSNESCDENTPPPKKTEVKNLAEFKAMTMTSLPPDHPFCNLMHGFKKRSKRKAIRDNQTSTMEPPTKMSRRESVSLPPPFRPTQPQTSQYYPVPPVPQVPSQSTFSQVPYGFIPGWPTNLPFAPPLPAAHSNNSVNTASDIHSKNGNTKDKNTAAAPLDLSKRSDTSDRSTNKKDSKPTVAPSTATTRSPTTVLSSPSVGHSLPPTGHMPIMPPYYNFPYMGMPGHVNPYLPTTTPGASPFMIPTFPGMFGNQAAMWPLHPTSNGVQKSS